MHLPIGIRYIIAILAMAGTSLDVRETDAQPLPNSPCGYCSWIELINDPIADGLFTEDGVTGYQYVYDVWIANGGTDNWEASFAIGGSRGPLGMAGTFDGRDAAWYRESQADGEAGWNGVWSVWYNSSAGRNSQAPEGSWQSSSWNAPAATWNKTDLVWETPVNNDVDRFVDVPLNAPLPWSAPNPYHSGEDYKWSSEYRVPGVGWSNDIPEDEGLVWGKIGGIWSGWSDGLEATIRVVHPNSPGSINYSFVNVGGRRGRQIVTGPNGAPVVVNPCIVGDANCDGYVDISSDILPGFSNFTGPGSFGKTRIQGDVQGDGTGATANLDPHDGDVDVSDLLTMFGAFTGPPPDEGGLAASEAGDPSVPDLIYDSATGEVVLDMDGAGIIGYVLKNGDGTFIAANHTTILGGVSTSLGNELSEAAFASADGSIGFVFPTGMNLAALSAYLTTNEVSTSLGAPVVSFDLVVLGPAVPESSTYAMAAFGLVALGFYGWRRKRA